MNLMCCVSKQHAWHIRPLLKSLRYSQPNTFRLGKISLNWKISELGKVQACHVNCHTGHEGLQPSLVFHGPRSAASPAAFFGFSRQPNRSSSRDSVGRALRWNQESKAKKNDDHNHNHKLNGRLFHVQFNYYSSSDQCAIPRRFWNLNHIDEATLGGEFPCQTKGWDQWRLIMGSWLKMNRFLFDC